MLAYPPNVRMNPDKTKESCIMNGADRIILPLDFATRDEAVACINATHNVVSHVKLGLEAINAGYAHGLLGILRECGAKVGWDIKLKDIPETIKRASAAIAQLGVAWFNVHGSARPEGIRAAVENAGDSQVYVVTVLTSMDDEQCRENYGQSVEDAVKQFAHWAADAGAHGLICSPRELKILGSIDRFKGMLKVTPSIRPIWAQAQDQKRTMTPGEAAAAGADYQVIGRPITRPPEEVGSTERAVELISAEIADGLTRR